MAAFLVDIGIHCKTRDKNLNCPFAMATTLGYGIYLNQNITRKGEFSEFLSACDHVQSPLVCVRLFGGIVLISLALSHCPS